MKTLKISFIVYDQNDNEIKKTSFNLSFYETLPPNMLRSALKMIDKVVSYDGYYVISDIEIISEDSNF